MKEKLTPHSGGGSSSPLSVEAPEAIKALCSALDQGKSPTPVEKIFAAEVGKEIRFLIVLKEEGDEVADRVWVYRTAGETLFLQFPKLWFRFRVVSKRILESGRIEALKGDWLPTGSSVYP